MCTLCGGAICNSGLCQPSTFSILYQYAHYGVFVAAGVALHWWSNLKTAVRRLFERIF